MYGKNAPPDRPTHDPQTRSKVGEDDPVPFDTRPHMQRQGMTMCEKHRRHYRGVEGLRATQKEASFFFLARLTVRDAARDADSTTH